MTANNKEPFVALALSGGGSRAMAFHLGCLRALHDRKILDKVKVLSTVSGGSVIGACWAYRGEEFTAFDQHVISVLRRGLQWDILRQAVFSGETPKILATLFWTGTLSLILWLLSVAISPSRWFGFSILGLEDSLAALARRLPVWGSLTTAFEAAMARQLFGNRTIDQVQKPGLITIVNACDLRTGTAFRFGSKKSGGWRYGEISGDPPTVAKAVAASAAFPLLLPPLVENFEFEKKGRKYRDTVSLTDGGVFDNLGVAVLEPGRAKDSIFNHPVSHIISLNAGPGQFESHDRHFWWVGRVKRSFEAVHRKSQDAVYQRLHKFAATGELQGFGMIYLGQQDDRLPWTPDDLVHREQVRNYPTDFAPMSVELLELLARRGEQLTHIIVDRYLSDLSD